MRRSSLLEVPLIILIGFALLWVTPKAVWRPYIIPDSTEVYYATRSLVEHGSYTITVNGAHHPPRYSYGYSVFFLAPAYRLTGRPEAMFAVPMLCGIANMALMYALTRRLFGPGVAVIAALLVPGLPAYYLTSWDILSHVPSLTLFLLITLLAPGACDRSWRGVLVGTRHRRTRGVAVTIRPTSVLFLLPPFVLLIAGLAPLPGRPLAPRVSASRGGRTLRSAAPPVEPADVRDVHADRLLLLVCIDLRSPGQELSIRLRHHSRRAPVLRDSRYNSSPTSIASAACRCSCSWPAPARSFSAWSAPGVAAPHRGNTPSSP